MFSKSILAFTALIVSAAAQSPNYGQCGGTGWTGPTTCMTGWTCVYSNPYYSQCLPGSSSTTTTTTTTTSSTSTTSHTTTTPATTTTSHTTSTTATTTTTSGGAGATLLPNNLWIRAVEDPNFHHYLQSSNPGTASTAVFGPYTSAAQFQLVNGQVEQQLSGGGLLYLTPIAASSSNATYLLTTFTTTPNTWGTWSFSGDGLNWSAANVTRSNTGAFLACGGGTSPTVNVNLGAYDYMTPAGCADETLNYYNGATAVD